MEQQIFNLIKDISYPALFALIFIILNKAGLLSLLVDFFRSKINGSVDPTVSEKLDKISGNHLGEIKELLMDIKDSNRRQEDKLEKMSDGIIYLKARANNK